MISCVRFLLAATQISYIRKMICYISRNLMLINPWSLNIDFISARPQIRAANQALGWLLAGESSITWLRSAESWNRVKVIHNIIVFALKQAFCGIFHCLTIGFWIKCTCLSVSVYLFPVSSMGSTWPPSSSTPSAALNRCAQITVYCYFT